MVDEDDVYHGYEPSAFPFFSRPGYGQDAMFAVGHLLAAATSPQRADGGPHSSVTRGTAEHLDVYYVSCLMHYVLLVHDACSFSYI